LFGSSKKTAKKVVAKSKLSPILSASTILSDPKRHEHIGQIYSDLRFIESRMTLCVKPLIDIVARTCQLLPSNHHPFYTSPGGLIDYALFRTKAAMRLFKQIALPPDTFELSEYQMRNAYLIYSAAMLRGIGALATDYEISLYAKNGNYIDQWKILSNDIPEQAEFYQFQGVYSAPEELRSHLTPLLAKQLIPDPGFSWLSEDQSLLLLWLKLLHEEREGLNILEAILEHAEILAWQEMAQFSLLQHPSNLNLPEQRRTGFIESPSLDNLQLQLIGLQFILWVNQHLARGQMLVNQTPIVALENGINISPEAFKWFLQHHPQFKNWRLIQQAVMSLGLHDPSVASSQGLVIKKFGYLLPAEVLVKNMNNQHHFKTQSIVLHQQWKQFIQGKKLSSEWLNQRLNVQGQWETQTQNPKGPGIQNV